MLAAYVVHQQTTTTVYLTFPTSEIVTWTRKRRKKNKQTDGVKGSKSENKVVDRRELTHDRCQQTGESCNERWVSPTKFLGVMKRSEETYPTGGLANYVRMMKTTDGSEAAEDSLASSTLEPRSAERGVLEENLDRSEKGTSTGQLSSAHPEELVERGEAFELEQAKQVKKSECEAHGATRDQRERTSSDNKDDGRTEVSSLYHEESWLQVGLKVWRIQGYEHGSRETALIPHIAPQDAPQCDLYSKDCYIVINTCLIGSDNSDLCHHVHSWIGQESCTVKQYAAEEHVADLTRRLSGSVVVHREVQYDESELFQSYFGVIFHNKGSSESRLEGLSLEALQDYRRFYLVKMKPKTINLYEVDRVASNMNHDSVFVLDSGKTINVWFGESSSPFERFSGSVVATNMVLQRPGCTKKHTTDDGDFLMSLGEPNGDSVPQHAASLSDTLQAVTHDKISLVQLHQLSHSSKSCFLLLGKARRNSEQTGCVRICSL